MWRSLVHTSRSPVSCAVARCTASAVRRKRSLGAETIRALVLRSYMLVEAGGKFVRVTGRQRAFAHAAMNYPAELGQSPQGRMDSIGCSDKFTNPGRFGFIEIEFGNIRGVEIHGAYRSRSSSIICELPASLHGSACS